MVSSVTEGEDKPLKYPLMFRACELVLVNKIDLLPHLDFDLDKFLHHLESVHPGVRAPARERAHRRRRRRLARLARERCAREPARGVTSAAGRRGAARATDAGERAFFTAEAERIALLCRELARALRPWRPPARRRRLGAGLVGRPPRRGRVRPPGDRRQAGAARPRGAARRARVAAPSRSDAIDRVRAARDHGAASGGSFEPPSDDPFVRQELCETLYHVLWELVHVFFEHLRGSSAGAGASPSSTRSSSGQRGRPRQRARRRPPLDPDEGRGGRAAAGRRR